MQTIGSLRPLTLAQAGFKQEVKTIFRGGIDRAKMVLVSGAGSDGSIPENSGMSIRAGIRPIISDMFTAHGTDNAFAQDGTMPLAPYPAALNRWLVWAVYQAVLPHEQWMRKHVPADVFNRLRMAHRKIISEEIKIFEPNPLAEIDPSRQWVPPHKWTDERGYRLSDRIWRTDLETRQKIDQILAQGLKDGKGALDIAQALEAYLQPGRQGIRTLSPYGRRFMPGGASYDAMRLARTEIARAFNQAAYIAGYLNPYTEAMEVARSANGDPTCPICPMHATIGMSGERLRPAYPKNAADMPPFHPHCMCYVFWTMTDKPETVTAELRQQLEDKQQELGINPADAWLFTQMLVGDALTSLLTQMGLHPTQEVLF